MKIKKQKNSYNAGKFLWIFIIFFIGVSLAGWLIYRKFIKAEYIKYKEFIYPKEIIYMELMFQNIKKKSIGKV